jgi:uncharacterized protein YwgA
VLNAFLKELGQSSDINTKDDRLRVQKAIYLGQLSCVDLGYRYNWYVHGPYSPSLTQDYYALDGLSESERQQAEAAELNQPTKAKLGVVRPLLQVPSTVQLAIHQWLELLCSWHYLRRVAGYSEQKATETLQQQKSHVAQYAAVADQMLRQFNLLPV